MSPTLTLNFCLFLLLLHCIGSGWALFEGCDHTYNLNPGISYLESPYYPSNYPSGTSCRYQFIAPLDYYIQVNCTINLPSSGGSCTTEFLYLATDGDQQLRNSEQFCGSGTFSRDSLFRSLTLAYASYGSSGWFRCSLSVVPQPCDCGWSVTTKIANGQEAGLNEFPFMVALQDTSSTQQSFCGASIIAHRWILTATHCVRIQPDPSKILALVGDHKLSSTSESRYAATYAIQQIYEYPGYTDPPPTNDLSLLKTYYNIEWSRGVGPVCLPPAGTTTYNYQYVDDLGWGTTSFGGPTSDVLLKANLMVIANDACQQAFPNVPISASQMCTNDYSGNGRDACQYDSGGPVVLRYSRMFQLGCISFGGACGQKYGTGVNTRISYFVNWIRQTTSYTTCVKALG